MTLPVDAQVQETPDAPESVGRVRRWRRRLADDRGLADGVEHLFAAAFLILLFLFIAQVVVWWHARNILEQAAAEGARVAAAADGSCGDAPGTASSIAERIGGGWVESVSVTCGGDTAGGLVTVRVSASTPAFFLPGTLSVSAVANAPEEAP
ncbi:MAG: hypothetical protein CL424_17020 [Acidimicrobiaceae bacterium]|nr:hypothetical protein [Acidimicrobiaceae bacterium]